MILFQVATFTFPARGGVAPTREQLFAAGPHTPCAELARVVDCQIAPVVL